MKISTPPRTRAVAVMALLVVLLSGFPAAPQSTKPLRFVGVDLNDETGEADRKLVGYLETKTGLNIPDEKQDDYGGVISKLVKWKEGEPYVARVTPYVFVVAQMMGAEFDVLATYKNMSDGTTYKSWFVINREDFQEFKDPMNPPKLDRVMEKLRTSSPPAKFIFHDKFSTSSYFLPSLEFRGRNIFRMTSSNKNLTAIDSQRPDGVSGSSDLVRRVAKKEAFLAAVWDGAKRKFEDKPENKPADIEDGKKVFFVEMPTVLPNDFLVCSSHLEETTKAKLSKAIEEMSPDYIKTGDFKTWTKVDQAAKEALASLRHSAEQRPAPITVAVTTSQNKAANERFHENLETIKQAIRLSGTELVLYDEDYHQKWDVIWNVEPIHDDAISLISKIEHTELAPQQLEISFTGDEDLTKRIGSFIQSRMHRIRYIWPYNNEHPTVVRDTVFPVSAQTQVKVMKITWTDLQKNDWSEGHSFDAKVVDVQKPNPFSIQLESAEFPKKGHLYDFDPMSNVSYRVVLVRSSGPGRVFTVLTYAFVGLLVLAAIGAFFDMKRRVKNLRDLPLVDNEKFRRTCRELVEKYRSFWRKHELTEADVLWCDRPRLEKIIADLKTSELNSVTVWTRSMAILANIPVVSKLLGLTVGAGVTEITTVNPEKFSDAQRLEDTIKYLIAKSALSPFIGEKLECDALNEIASSIFEPFSLATSQAGNTNGGELIRNEHPMLVSLIAKHFNGVIQESKEKVCFFSRKWTVTANETEQVLVCTADLITPIKLNGGNSAVPKTVQKLTLRAQVSRDADLGDLSQGNEVNAWLFGKIHRVEPPRNGDGNLFLNFRPAALVKTDDSE